MTAERWEQVQTVFVQAVDLPPDARAAYLDRACGGDDALRREVASLLAEAERPGPVDALADALVGPLTAPWRSVPPDEHVGPYRIVRTLGHGGMGAVYLAERADGQFEQRVALKVLPDAAGGSRVDRFLHERQILARLVHPHVARLLDGGVTERGVPYFAMEYVEGEPIDVHCARRALPVERRLALMRDVCAAVRYAHQNLVVHRDLKPSNILVTADGQVKLLDFGIAKLLADAAAEAPLRTRTGLRPMTPEYAAPEQVRGEPVTTATDVYALGVVLYELLVGQRPYRLDGRSPSAVERVVCETEPLRPSAAVLQGGAPDAARRARRLAGDLDTIVLKALRKDPDRRYASAEALADDLARHLEGRAVLARPDTWGYRTRVFVRRHRVGVAAALLLAAVLVAGLAGTGWQARRVAEQARVAAAERDRARQEADKAERVAAFLVDLFRAPDPAEARGDTLTTYDVLARGVDRVDRELAGQPLVRATLLHTLGQTYVSLGDYGRAAGLLDSAVVLRRRHAAPARELAEALRDRGQAATLGGDYEGAGPWLEEALAVLEGDGAEVAAPADVAAVLVRLGNLHHDAAALEASEAAYRRAMALLEADGAAPGSEDYAHAVQHLALLLQDQGRTDEALPLFADALAAQRARLEPPHPDLALLLNDYGLALRNAGRPAEAVPLLHEALAMQRTLFGAAHPQLVYSLTNLAVIVQGDDPDEAERLLGEAQQIGEVVFEPAHPARVITLGLRAGVARRRGVPDAARQRYEEALAAARTAFPAGHPRRGWLQAGLGGVLLEEGRAADAEPLLRASAATLAEHFGPGHPLTLQAGRGHADALAALGRPDAAAEVLRAQHDHLAAAHGPDDDRTRETRRRLADLYDAAGRPADAAALRTTSSLPPDG